MSVVLTILGALGGVVVFGGAVWTVIRAIFKQVGATEDNTKALHDLQRTVESLNGRLNDQDGRLHDHGERIARLEGARQ